MNIEKIAQLAEEALVNIKIKYYAANTQDWYGYAISPNSKEIARGIAALEQGDTNPILMLVKKMDKTIRRCEEDNHVFYEELYQYQLIYENVPLHRINYYQNTPSDLVESRQQSLQRLKEISAELKTELNIPQSETQKEKHIQSKHYIISLLTEALYQIRMPVPAHLGQPRDFTRIRDLIPFEQIEHAIEALDNGNLDPVLDLMRFIAKTISDHIDNIPLFLSALEAYREEYNPAFFTISPDEVALIHQKNLARLKDIYALLKSAVLDPSLQFLAIVGDNQADKSKPSPAHLFFKDGANHDLLKIVMQYTGFFNRKLIEKPMTESLEKSTSLQG
ncbi:hypothetical protein [Legionella erythra]|nr:hypothetical protein [Legionella erythra]